MDALRLMEAVDQKGQRIPFDIKGVKFNRKSREGGSIYSHANCVLPYGVETPKKGSNQAANIERDTKRPNHYKNATRNIQTATGDLVKINIWLIQHFTFQGELYEIIL